MTDTKRKVSDPGGSRRSVVKREPAGVATPVITEEAP